MKVPSEQVKASEFRVIWNKNLDPDYESGNLPISLAAPLIHKGMVFAGTATGRMNAYHLKRGTVIWSQYDGEFYTSRPAIHQDHLVYGNSAGRVFSRHYLTGKLKYSVDLGAAIEAMPFVYQGRVFFHLRNHKIVAMDVVTGKILWSYRRSVPFTTSIQRVSRPNIYQNKLYVGFADGYITSFSIEEGVLLWEKKISQGAKFIDVDMSPVIREGKLIVGSMAGEMVVLDPKTGITVSRLPYISSQRPLKLKDNLLIGTIDGYLVMLDKNLKEIAKSKVSKGTISSMGVWKKHIVVGTTKGEIHFIKDTNLIPKDTFYLGSKASSIFGRFEIGEGALVVYSSRNRLYTFN